MAAVSSVGTTHKEPEMTGSKSDIAFAKHMAAVNEMMRAKEGVFENLVKAAKTNLEWLNAFGLKKLGKDGGSVWSRDFSNPVEADAMRALIHKFLPNGMKTSSTHLDEDTDYSAKVSIDPNLVNAAIKRQ